MGGGTVANSTIDAPEPLAHAALLPARPAAARLGLLLPLSLTCALAFLLLQAALGVSSDVPLHIAGFRQGG